jgi:hypothetical protein
VGLDNPRKTVPLWGSFPNSASKGLVALKKSSISRSRSLFRHLFPHNTSPFIFKFFLVASRLLTIVLLD